MKALIDRIAALEISLKKLERRVEEVAARHER